MAGRKTVPSSSQVSEALLSELRECLAQRCIERGLGCLRDHAALLNAFDPCQPEAARFVGHLAQWIDVGAFDSSALKAVLRRFDTATRGKLPLHCYLYLRMAEGMLAMAEEEIDTAIRHFDFVLGLPDELNDKQSLSIVFFWTFT